MARTYSPGSPIERDRDPIAEKELARGSGGPAADTAPRLRAPAAEEAWRVSAVASRPADDEAVAGRSTELPSQPIGAVSQAPSERRTLSAGMGVAAVIVTAVLVGMALLSHGNG